MDMTYKPQRETLAVRVMPGTKEAFDRLVVRMSDEQGTRLTRGQVFEQLVALALKSDREGKA